jgi:hypothetical protein
VVALALPLRTTDALAVECVYREPPSLGTAPHPDSTLFLENFDGVETFRVLAVSKQKVALLVYRASFGHYMCQN